MIQGAWGDYKGCFVQDKEIRSENYGGQGDYKGGFVQDK